MRFENKTLAVLVVMLFLSLMGNMFALGYVMGGGHKEQVEATSGRQKVDRDLRADLSQEDKGLIRREMMKNRDVLREKQTAWKDARKASSALLGQDQYDAAEYSALKEIERTAFLEMQKEMERIWGDIAPQLSEDGRKKVSKIMEQGVSLRSLRKAISKEGSGFKERGDKKPRSWQDKPKRDMPPKPEY